MFKKLAMSVAVVASSMTVVGNVEAASSSSPAVTPAAAAQPAAPAPKTYVVVSGDNLSDIAAGQGLDSWRPIWNVNDSVTDPNLIYAGQSLVIPTGPTTDREIPASVSATAAALDAASSSQTSVIQRAAPTHAANYAAGAGGLFARIRQRESGGNYATNTGNGYYGAYQYDLRTWNNYGGYARPDLAPPAVQDAKAAETYAARGCSPWPNTCY